MPTRPATTATASRVTAHCYQPSDGSPPHAFSAGTRSSGSRLTAATESPKVKEKLGRTEVEPSMSAAPAIDSISSPSVDGVLRHLPLTLAHLSMFHLSMFT